MPIIRQCLERAQNKTLKKWEAVNSLPFFEGVAASQRCESFFADTAQAIFSRNLLQLYFDVPGTIWAPQHEISVYDIHLLGTTSLAPWAPFRRFVPSDRATRQKRNPLKPLRLKGFVAEAVGFEPTCPCGQLDFESSSLRPLRYVSIYN